MDTAAQLSNGEGVSPVKPEMPVPLAKTWVFNPAFPRADATQLVPGMGGDELTEGALQVIERHMASVIGPLAKILVKREAAKTNSVAELYDILATRLESEEDRKAFLARRTEAASNKGPGSVPAKRTPGVASPAAEGAAPAEIGTSNDISTTVIEQAARKLAAHLGPIGLIVAKKEAKRATSVRHFYELLAGHVDVKERERFLSDAGVVKDAPTTSFLHRPDGNAFLTKSGEKTSAHTKPISQTEQKS
jgi:serine/threonine-protein kinase